MRDANFLACYCWRFAATTSSAYAADKKEDADKKRKPDLGDAAQGTYFGDVISDSQGSSKSEVTLTITRIAKNKVRIDSDYPRLPVVEVALTSAMGKILNGGSGNTSFVLDPEKSPAGLDVSFNNEVSWSGVKQ
ncbi:MAG: hypothetical protein U1F34_05010 [Gammaproteobacteria bacterium]